MKLYSLDPYNANQQTFKKYCGDLDQQIIAIQNYIDFKSPNYIGLNNTTPQFFKQEDLITLNILNNDQNIIYPENMCAGQIVHQNWTTDTVTINGEAEGTIPSGLPNGWALIKHADSYEKFSLASAGDFYVLTKVETPASQTLRTTWTFMQNAASTFGTNYTFSLLAPNSRFFFYDAEATGDKTRFHPTNWAHISIPNWYKNNNEVTPQLITKQPSLWDATFVLSHEVFFDDEEVFCDDTHNYDQQVFEKRSLSLYNINTNIGINNSNFYIYFY